jgi:ribosomal protein S18 acetylase RimI-like enzyme
MVPRFAIVEPLSRASRARSCAGMPNGATSSADLRGATTKGRTDRRRPFEPILHEVNGSEVSMRFDLRMLGPKDACAFRALRLEALARHPCAFAATHDEESGQSAGDVAERLVRQAVFGGFVAGALEGVAGFATPGLAKKMHKGILWGVYVAARRRGHGLGRALVAQVIEHARGRVAQLHAAVVTGNAAACGLYRDLGFVTYGIEPRALKVGETYFDQALMVLMLDEPSRSDRGLA